MSETAAGRAHLIFGPQATSTCACWNPQRHGAFWKPLPEAAAPASVASPSGYWEASGDINPDQAQSMGPVLEEAAANRKQLVVHEGITLRWRSAVASPAPLDAALLFHVMAERWAYHDEGEGGTGDPPPGGWRSWRVRDPMLLSKEWLDGVIEDYRAALGQPVAEEPA